VCYTSTPKIDRTSEGTMTKTILIAGASGLLGREVVHACKQRGHKVIGLVRDAKKANGCDEVRVADAANLSTLSDVCRGVDVLFSCIGASVSLTLGKGWRSFSAVDIPTNLNLLRVARESKVKRFVYVSFHGAREMMHLDYAIAHEKVVDAIKESDIPYGIMRPVGFFSALGELQDLARLGFVPQIGSGVLQTNPIHDADLAEACAEMIDDEANGSERSLGGPELLTRDEISRLAFTGLEKTPRVLKIPPWIMKMNGLLSRPFHPRISHALAFFATISTRESIAPKSGSKRLGDYYRERAISLVNKS
jgi:uncharacterized protein YbjT (DUF2867 family)